MKSKADNPTVNSGSMADIAFLLLIFFLVTTTITQEEGITLKLPPEPEKIEIAPIHNRNLFKILINSNNQFLIEGDLRNDLTGLREEIQAFVLNNGRNPEKSVSPDRAVISIKANRGTDYKYFIEALDEVKGMYYDLYARNVGLTNEEYMRLDPTDPVEGLIYQKGKRGIPMNISIAEPSK